MSDGRNWGQATEYIPPQVGDVVELPTHRGNATAVVVDNTCETGWCDILLGDGTLLKWPTIQLKVLETNYENR